MDEPSEDRTISPDLFLVVSIFSFLLLLALMTGQLGNIATSLATIAEAAKMYIW